LNFVERLRSSSGVGRTASWPACPAELVSVGMEIPSIGAIRVMVEVSRRIEAL
jgi:hypothetical protein